MSMSKRKHFDRTVAQRVRMDLNKNDKYQNIPNQMAFYLLKKIKTKQGEFRCDFTRNMVNPFQLTVAD